MVFNPYAIKGTISKVEADEAGLHLPLWDNQKNFVNLDLEDNEFKD